MGCGCGGGGRNRGRGVSGNRSRRVAATTRGRAAKPKGVRQKIAKAGAIKGTLSPVDMAKQRIARLRREAIRRTFGK